MQTSNKSDAGWNDPPNFSYSESAQYSKSPKRNLLNKRVAFPLNSATSPRPPSVDPTATAIFNPNLPPPPVGVVPLVSNFSGSSCSSVSSTNKSVVSSAVSDDSPAQSVAVDDEIRLNEVIKNLNEVMEAQNDLLDSNNADDSFKKKLSIMKESWTSKLSDDIKEKLLMLSKALKDKDERIADEIHISLMVDYPKLCSDFISVFRQLLNRMKLDAPIGTQRSATAPDEEQSQSRIFQI